MRGSKLSGTGRSERPLELRVAVSLKNVGMYQVQQKGGRVCVDV